MQPEARKDLYEKIEKSPGHITEPGLMNSDEFALEGARTHGGIGAGGLQSRKQLIHLFDGSGKVGVCEKYELAPRFQNSVANREAFAMISVVPNQTDGGKLADYLDGLVRGAVLHYDQLNRVRLHLPEVTEPLQGVTDTPCFVIGGNHNAEERRCHRSREVESQGVETIL